MGKAQQIPIDAIRSLYNYPTAAFTESLTDQDTLGHFGPSRLPPRIAFRMPSARDAIEKAITDLPKEQKGAHPATIEISLDGPQYRHLTRPPITLVVKRKSASLYKGPLCTRGDVIPLSAAGFVSRPTARRCAVKIVCSRGSGRGWNIKALDISQASLQSENLRPSDRIIAPPPEMATLPWKGELPPPQSALT